MEIELGMIVYSKSGRDKGRPFVVTGIEGDYVYLVDGDMRKLAKPKRKKKIHLQKTNFVNPELREKLENNGYLLDADFRKALLAVGRSS